MTTLFFGQPIDLDNQSILGEEDPGAAIDSMPSQVAAVLTNRIQLRKALSRWENEGGFDGHEIVHCPDGTSGQTEVNLTNAELVQMQIRIIALESLVTALLAGAPDGVTELARKLADCISPRAGCTPHHLTLHATSQMVHITQRSELFRRTGGSVITDALSGNGQST